MHVDLIAATADHFALLNQGGLFGNVNRGRVQVINARGHYQLLFDVSEYCTVGRPVDESGASIEA